MCSMYFSDVKSALGLKFAAFRRGQLLLNTPLKSSTPAFSTSATWCHVLHSRVFHSRVFSAPGLVNVVSSDSSMPAKNDLGVNLRLAAEFCSTDGTEYQPKKIFGQPNPPKTV